MERVEMMFEEMMVAEGFEAWYEAEHRWDAWAEAMVAAGCDADEVEDFFSAMTWDL